MSLIHSILGLLLLLANIFAILKIAQSSESSAMKVLWIFLILILPVIGLVVWFFAGPGDKSFTL